jgi:hypothetical protein
MSTESIAPSNPYRAPDEPTAGLSSTKSVATKVPTKAESIYTTPTLTSEVKKARR